MAKKISGFRSISLPDGMQSRYTLVVVDEQGMPSLALTEFYHHLQQDLSDGAARAYLNALLPYFTYLRTDARRCQRRDLWDGEPETVRLSVRDYLLHQLGCKVRRHNTYEMVRLTACSPSTVRVFLSALKRFYQFALETKRYSYEHPLVDPAAHILRHMELHNAEERTRPRMPQESGVEPPRSRPPLENYFRLTDDGWKPEPIDDPGLPGRLMSGFKAASLSVRDQVVVRMAFESGARISEILGLTVGDWRVRGGLQEAAAFSKGSQGRRVKFVRFSPETAKWLHRYVNGERMHLDAQQRGLTQLADSDPLFLSTRRHAYGYKAFQPHWSKLCQVTGVTLNVHGLRHWYATAAIRLIYEHSSTQAEIERRKEDLVQYMAWRSAETLAVYEHYFQAKHHAEIQDRLYQRMHEDLRRDMEQEKEEALGEAGERQANTAHQIAPTTPVQGDGWERLLMLGGVPHA